MLYVFSEGSHCYYVMQRLFKKTLCRKHFNEHRDVLSKDLNSVFDQHDGLMQELQLKMDCAHKSTDNENARAILKRIDEWEAATITKRASEVANEARANIERFFNRKPRIWPVKAKDW